MAMKKVTHKYQRPNLFICGYDPIKKIPPHVRVLFQAIYLETKSLEVSQIDPEHYFLGLLKVRDLSWKDNKNITIYKNEELMVSVKIHHLIRYWFENGFDCVKARRKFRTILLDMGYAKKNNYSIKTTARCNEMLYMACELAEKELRNKPPGFMYYLTACLLVDSPAIDKLFEYLEMNKKSLIPSKKIRQEELYNT